MERDAPGVPLSLSIKQTLLEYIMALTKKLSIERHQAIGEQLKRIEVELLALRGELSANYGTTSTPVSQIDGAKRRLLLLRSAMESRYFAEHKAAASVTTYFGPL